MSDQDQNKFGGKSGQRNRKRKQQAGKKPDQPRTAKPDQVEAFEKHYAETHIKLAAKVPHLRSLTAGRMERGFAGGKPTNYRIVELTLVP